jgi:hypothetical protein
MELKWFDGLLVCSRPELLQRSLLHHQARRDFTVIRQKVELLMAVICAAPSKCHSTERSQGHEGKESGARIQEPGGSAVDAGAGR